MLNDQKLLEQSREMFLLYCMSAYPEFKINHHHRLIAKKLESILDGNKRIIINMPPRHGKTFMCSQLFPCWYLGRRPNEYIISASYGQDLSNDFGRFVRNTMQSDNFKSVFSTRIAQDSSSKKRFNTNSGGSYFAVGRGGPVTGRGGHVIIIDDLLKNEQEARSPMVRDAMKEWFRNTLYTRLMPNGSIVVINTRWHTDDLCGWLLEEQPGVWDVLDLPAIDNGKALWEEMYPIEVLNDIKKAIGSRAFESLYQQSPILDGGNIIKKDWIKSYDVEPRYYSEIIQSWDLTFKGTDKSDYVVGQCWGKSGVNMYLIDQVRGQWDFNETVRQVISFSRKHPNAGRKYIEDKANGPALMSYLKDRVDGLIPWNPTGSKEGRLNAVSPLFESGNIFFPSYKEFTDLITNETISFPNGKNDDMVDAMTQAILNLRDMDGVSFEVGGGFISDDLDY